jgi:hypothetical protein
VLLFIKLDGSFLQEKIKKKKGTEDDYSKAPKDDVQAARHELTSILMLA